MIAVKIGTTSWRATDTLAADEVAFDGIFVYAPDRITPHMVWDEGLNNIRAMTQAEIDALPAQQATARAITAKTQAAASIDNGATIAADQRERIERCIVDIIRAEFNRHTDVEASMFAAVAAATSLADLKTRYAAITQVPQRSLADLVAAIKTALAATPE